MPTSSDEIGQSVERAVSRALSDVVRTLWRNHLRNRAAESGIVEEAAAAATPGNPYAIIAFKDAALAERAAELVRASPEWPPNGAGTGLLAVNGEFVALPKAAMDAAAAILDKEGIPFAVVVEEVSMDTVRSQVAARDWDAVTLTEELSGAPLPTELVDRVSAVIAEAGIDHERASNVLVFRAADRDRVIDAVNRSLDRPVSFSDVALESRARVLAGPATERQLEKIDELAKEGKISDADLANFRLAETKQAAHDLITSAIGDEGWSDRAGEPSGPQIARDSLAARRREDIGNVQTTADYVQARPKAGDQDRSTPYPDQCDAPGSGDLDGDGIRDAAEDRDGDGVLDADDPDSNPPTEKFAKEKAEEARSVESRSACRGRDAALQVETR